MNNFLINLKKREFNQTEIKSFKHSLTLNNIQIYCDSFQKVNESYLFINGKTIETTNEIYNLYKQDPDTFTNSINGDFSLVIIDENKIILAKDYYGSQPLYYYQDNDFYLISNNFKNFFNYKINKDFDSEKELEYLAGHFFDQERTLYKNIKRVLPNTILVLSNNTKKLSKIKQSTNEQTKTFLNIFQNAVDIRTSDINYFTELSGGYDSSSVYSLSNLKNSVSIVFPSLVCNEEEYIDEVISKYPGNNKKFEYQRYDLSFYYNLARRYKYIPEYPNSIQAYQYLEFLKSQNINFLLTGYGGDHLLTGDTYKKYIGIRQKFKSLFLNKFKLRRYINKKPIDILNIDANCKYLDRFVHQTYSSNTDLNEFQNNLIYQVTNANLTEYIESSALLANEFEITKLHPLFDKNIFSYCFYNLSAINKNKQILKDSFLQFLPAKILNRNDKADFTYLFKKIIYTPEALSELEDAIKNYNHYLDLPYLSENVVKIKQGQETTPVLLLSLWKILSLNLFKKTAGDF